ncbi:MAG: hypothetical protein R3B96_19955 [Pirellulaceae bacterium]
MVAAQWRVQEAPHRVSSSVWWPRCFCWRLTDIAATNLVLPPGVDTASRRLLGMVHAGVDDQVAAITLDYGLAALLLGGLAARLGRSR